MSSTFKRYLGEGLLIVFSVLFALFINKLVDDSKTQDKKEIAISGISNELYRNQAIIQRWKKHHISIQNRTDELLKGKKTDLRDSLESYEYLNLSLLTNEQSFVDAIITNTAWESAKSTGIISEFDFETTQKLTHVYAMQDVLMDRTLMEIIDLYFDSDSHDLSQLDKTLLLLQLRLSELVGQEYLMEELYAKAIKALDSLQ